MTGPRLEACYFASDRADDPFVRMARVLEATAAEHCPSWERSVAPFVPVPRSSPLGVQAHAVNVQKIERWAALVAAAADGERLLLLDADVAILRPLDDIWTREFDLAYTVKRRPFPFNLGVLFVRVSPRVRQFFEAWRDLNLRLLAEPEGHEVWRHRFGGINQASFGALLEQGSLSDLLLERLPCAVWNCEESGWPTFDPAVTRILHVKGLLRRAMFRRFPPVMEILAPLTFYRALEARVASLARSA